MLIRDDQLPKDVKTHAEYYAKRFSQADIDRVVKAERDRIFAIFYAALQRPSEPVAKF